MQSRYQNIKITKYQDKGDQYYLNNIYPDIPSSENDNYVISTLGDRLDLLALDFYGDVSFWWVIASANALSGDSLYIEPGLQIRIPNDLASILNQYRYTNLTR
jgi:hypothetical protein